MKINMGGIDRMLRIIVGLTLIVTALMGYIGAWGFIGIIPLATGVMGVCPAYLPFGISTCRLREGGRKQEGQ